MAIPWKQVELNPDFQALSPDQKVMAQEQYFNEVVAPQAGDMVNEARSQFFSQYRYNQPSGAQQYKDAKTDEQGNITDYGTSAIPGNEDVMSEEEKQQIFGRKLSDMSLGDKAIGLGEAALSAFTGSTSGMLSGAAGGIVGAISDLAGVLTPEEAQSLQQRAASAGTYEPKTEAGRKIIGDVGEAAQWLPPMPGTSVGKAPLKSASKAPSISNETARAVRFAEKTGAPLTATDIAPPKTFAGKGAVSLAEKVPLAGTGGIRSKQQAERQRVTSDFIDSYDKVTDQDLYRSLVDSKDAKSQAIASRYDKIGEQMSGIEVPASKTISKIDSEIERLNQPGRVKDSETITKLQDLKSDLESGTLDYQGMRENRTLIREKLKSDQLGKTSSDRVIDNVYRSMTEDIQDAVKAGAGNEAAFKLKQVDSILAKQYAEAKKTKLKNVLQKGDVKPEEVSKMLLSNDKSENFQLYKSLDKGGRKNARGFLVSELGKAFEENESPEKFMQKAKKLENQFDIFFKGDEGEAMKDLVAYLNKSRQAAKAGVLNQNGQQIMTLITALPIASDFAGTGGVATASAISAGLLGRAIESRKVRSALKKIKSARPYTPEYNQALIALDNAVNEIEE